MDRQEIHRLALLATAKITFVLAASCTQESRAVGRDTSTASSLDDLATTAAHGGATTAPSPAPAAEGTSCKTRGWEASRAASSQPTNGGVATTAPTSKPVPQDGVEADLAGCVRSAAAANGVKKPVLEACCSAALSRAHRSDGASPPPSWSNEAWACCDQVPSDKRFGLCSPWGPPAPPAMPKGWA
jgi:hypothetical protein